MKHVYIITKKDGNYSGIVAAFANIAAAFARMDEIRSNVLQDVPAPLASTVETIDTGAGIRFIKFGSKQWHIVCQELCEA